MYILQLNSSNYISNYTLEVNIMKRLKKIFRIIAIFLLVLLLINNNKAYAKVEVPNELIINTSKEVIGKAYYFNSVISIRKINSELGVGYCLEISKDYPNGENFLLKGYSNRLIENILFNGYPNKTKEQLGVPTDDDAYFATQIALWSVIEGYNINEISSYDINVTNAIKEIYNKAHLENLTKENYSFIEYSSEEHIQDIVFLLENNEPIYNQKSSNNIESPLADNITDSNEKISLSLDSIPKTGYDNNIIYIFTEIASLSTLLYLKRKK